MGKEWKRYEIPTYVEWDRCKACKMEIIWIENENKKIIPVTRAGINHFIDCPKANTFRTEEF